MGDHPLLDVNRIVEIFDRHRVQYLLVGGVAARRHGATRLTEDVDVLPADDDENLRALPELAFASHSAAMDGGFTAVTDVSSAMAAAGMTEHHRLIGGVAHVRRSSGPRQGSSEDGGA